MIDNRQAFAGTMPEFYERDMVPMLFEPHARIMAARLAKLTSGRVLEIAAGTGAATRAMAKVLPDSVSIIATDLNETMLERARSRPGSERMQWRQADAMSLPFPDRHFDAVVCQFGVMFVPDKQTAFREALRVLQPGGQYIFSVWDRLELNVLNDTGRQAIESLVPDNPPVRHLIPFSYNNPDIIRLDLDAAGFRDVTIDVVAEQTRAPTPRAAANGYFRGTSCANEIGALGPGLLERAIESAAAALTARFGDGPIAMPNQALLVTARRPGD